MMKENSKNIDCEGVIFSEKTYPKMCFKNFEVLLMVQKSGVHQLRLVVYPIIYEGFYTSQVVVWDFFHQQ